VQGLKSRPLSQLYGRSKVVEKIPRDFTTTLYLPVRINDARLLKGGRYFSFSKSKSVKNTFILRETLEMSTVRSSIILSKMISIMKSINKKATEKRVVLKEKELILKRLLSLYKRYFRRNQKVHIAIDFMLKLRINLPFLKIN